MMNIEKVRMSPADFLEDAAIRHFKKTGHSVKGFIVPTAMWLELKKDPGCVLTNCKWTIEVDGFEVIPSNFVAPCLVEDVTNRVFNLD